MSTDTEFLGMPIEGLDDYGRSTKSRVEQYSKEQFQLAIEKVIKHPEVTGIGWVQATPYFNDGEPCVFRIGEPYFSFAGTHENEDSYFDYGWMEDDFDKTGRVWCGQYCNSSILDEVVGKDDRDWGPWTGYTGRDRTWTWAEGSGPDNAPDRQLFEDVHEFMTLLGSGHFEHAAEDLFGDHVTVIIDVAANKIILDEYEHD